MNVCLNEITGESVTLKGNHGDKQGVWSDLALDNRLFCIPVYNQFHGGGSEPAWLNYAYNIRGA